MRGVVPSLVLTLAILQCAVAPPVTPEKSTEKDSEMKDYLLVANHEQNFLELLSLQLRLWPEIDLQSDTIDKLDTMEYNRYLKEVVQALESDPEFRKRLEQADEEDVRSGKIAEKLDFVSHNVRTRLDEIKRREMERLKHLATKQYELSNDLDTNMGKVSRNDEHLDHGNPHTFEIEDLKKLIKKTTADLEEADKKRREEFKEYKMHKEYQKQKQLETMNETEKKQFLEKQSADEEAKKHHQPLHHPGSKPQLEEVWEKQDHMDQQFDPKVFFMMHDVDGNGVWDADEVKALFIKELDKVYVPGSPDNDLYERAEEMERMREHVFKENDRNRDGLIDFNEFMLETQKAEFNRDEGWKPIDENQIYTRQEYDEYDRRAMEEFRYLHQRGLIDAQGKPLPGAEHQIDHARRVFHEQYEHGIRQSLQQYPQGQYPQQAQMPQQYPAHGQVPQGQFAQGQYPAQGQFAQGQYPAQGQVQQPPQGQIPSGQVPQGQFAQGQYPAQRQVQQPPQGQIPSGQVPQGQYPAQGQVQQPPQGQIPSGQVPQGQYLAQGQVQQPPQGQIPSGQVPQGQNQAGQMVQPQNSAPEQGQPIPNAAQNIPENQNHGRQERQTYVQSQDHGQPPANAANAVKQTKP